MHSLLHDIPRFLILFLEELFLIFNQTLSILAFGKRDIYSKSESLRGVALRIIVILFQQESGCRPIGCHWDVNSNSCGYFQIKQNYYSDCHSPGSSKSYLHVFCYFPTSSGCCNGQSKNGVISCLPFLKVSLACILFDIQLQGVLFSRQNEKRTMPLLNLLK